MKIFCLVLMCFGCFIVSAHAATLFTGQLAVPSGDTGACGLVNVSDAPIDVTIIMYDGSGSEFSSATPTVAPRHAVSIGGDVADSYYCEFRVPGKKKVRAGAYALQTSTGRITASLAAE